MAGGSKQLVLCTLAAALLFGSYLATMASAQNFKQEDLDFADAEEDPVTGQLCITRKYCLSNTDALAGRLPAQPCIKSFAPGCNCDVASDCPNATAPHCNNCVCSPFPQGCDCLSSADCDNFSGFCIDCVCSPFAPGCNCEGDHDCPDSGYCVDCQCSAYPKGCDCNRDGDCPNNGYCVDCQCNAFPKGCDCTVDGDCPNGYCVDCQCSAFRRGCSCNSNGDCPNNGYCVDCNCNEFPAGCDCNSASDCPRGDYCNNCQCSSFPPGCNCDTAADCPNDGYCVDCRCSAYPPGCTCEDDSDCGGGTNKCVNCMCKDCPVSTFASNTVINPPLTFVVDTTKSVKPDKYSIFNLTQMVVGKIQETDANIPSYLLVTFNDHGPDFNKNVRIGRETQDVIQFKQDIISLRFESYDGGRDSKERLMQGLLGALNATPEKSLVVVFTDNGSKDLKLKGEIKRLKQQRLCTVYIVLTPIFEGFPNDPSLDVYAEIADQVFFISEVGAEVFLTTVETFEQSNCL